MKLLIKKIFNVAGIDIVKKQKKNNVVETIKLQSPLDAIYYTGDIAF